MYKFGSVNITRGLSIAYQEWGIGNKKRILALHGWLDNSNSFSYLGPKLADLDYHIIAVDLIGHGKSSHLSNDAVYNIFNYIPTIMEFQESVGWNSFTMMGHSMGGVIGSLFSSVYNERIENLIMIDSLGPWTQPSDKAVAILKRALENDIKFTNRMSTKERKQYATLDDAVLARMNNVKNYPGQQFISKEAALALVRRGVACHLTSNDPDLLDLRTGPVSFSHDPKLMKLSYYYLNNDQAVQFMNAISCPTLLLTGDHGWPLGVPSDVNARKKPLEDKGLLTHVELPGSHHLHLDPESAPKVLKSIHQFMSKSLHFDQRKASDASD